MAMSMKEAQQVYDHLLRTGQAFCFTDWGIINREACQEMLFGKSLQQAIDKAQVTTGEGK